MGTRADFYVGRGESAEWLGSTAWDGYPSGISQALFEAKTEQEFKEQLEKFFEGRTDVTRPEQGWPWPWEDSRTTDYAYAFDPSDQRVWASGYGYEWFDPKAGRPERAEDDPPRKKTAVFPNMRDRQNVTLGPRSGVMIFRG